MAGATGYWDKEDGIFRYTLGSGFTSLGVFAWNKTHRQQGAAEVTGRTINSNAPTSFIAPQNGKRIAYLGHISDLPDQKFHVPFKANVVAKFKSAGSKEPKFKKVDTYTKNGSINPETEFKDPKTETKNYFERLGSGNVVVLYSVQQNQFVVYTNVSNKAYDQFNNGNDALPSNEFDMNTISGNLDEIPSTVSFGKDTADTMPGKSIGMMVFPGNEFGINPTNAKSQMKEAVGKIEARVKANGVNSLTSEESRWQTEINCSYLYLNELKACINFETLEVNYDDGRIVPLQQILKDDTAGTGIVDLGVLATQSLKQLKKHVK
ncbi:MAG: hypothetical protein WCK98_03370 [bacterium]